MDTTKKIIHGKYFPHIDGIRALAVLAVVFYHLWAPLCPGGFVGVDVFFVISGFLITGGILRGLNKGTFTIRDFYYRRIKRILPAYFVMIMGVFVMGVAVYYSTPLTQLGDSIVMGTLFMANLYYWKIGGDYFAPDIHGSPLLHLWSLSVEEQFYLFIPILIIVIWKLRKKWIFHVIALLMIFSFAGAVYSVWTGSAGNAFYLPHFRAWELLAGSLLALIPAVKEKRIIHAWLAGIGLLLILGSYTFLTSEIPFPGVSALPSVLGTVLLIRYGSTGYLDRLLSSRPFVGIGKISYSLYLWHWPVIVFWKYVTYDQLYFLDYIGILILSFSLSYLSWRFVESPVRKSEIWTLRRTFSFGLLAIVLLLCLGITTAFSRGYGEILHKNANKLILYRPAYFIEGLIKSKCSKIGVMLGCDVDMYEPFPFSLGASGDFKFGANGDAEVLLVGDSHAGSLQYGLDKIFKLHERNGFVISRAKTSVYEVNTGVADRIITKLRETPSIKKVIIAEYWSHEYRYSTPELMYKQLEEFAVLIQSMDRQLFILTDVPVYDFSPTEVAAKARIIPPREKISDVKFLSRKEYENRHGDINRALRLLCEKTNAILLPIHTVFQRGDKYIAFDNIGGEEVPLYKDANHLSLEGSIMVGEYIYPYLFSDSHKAASDSVVQDQLSFESIR